MDGDLSLDEIDRRVAALAERYRMLRVFNADAYAALCDFDAEDYANRRESYGRSDEMLLWALENCADPDRLLEFFEERMRCRAEAAEAAQEAIAALHGRVTMTQLRDPEQPVDLVDADDIVRPPPMAVLIADTLARHAPPVRALTPSAREARAA